MGLNLVASSSHYVVVSDHANLRPEASPLTIAVLATPANVNQNGILVSKRLNGAPFEQYSLGLRGDLETVGASGQNLSFLLVETSPSTNRGVRSSEDVCDGNAHLYAATHDGAGTVAQYQDGVLLSAAATFNAGGTPTVNNTDNLFFGQFGNGGVFFNGPFHWIALWFGTALSAAQLLHIRHAYGRTWPVLPTQLWRMIGTDGATASGAGSIKDTGSVAGGHNGTPTNSPTYIASPICL